MDRFLEYITMFDPAFASRIEGALDAEIERLERVVGGPLPDDYRAFLGLMGRRDDAIVGSDDIMTAATDIADFYEESVASGENSVPADCIVFAISGLSIEQLYIERDAPHRVFQTENDAKGDFWAASFRGFLHQQAFKRSPRITFLADSNPEPRRERAERLLEGLGMKRLWFSDEVTLCYESEDDRITVRQIAGRPVWVYISSPRRLRRWTLAWRVSRALGIPLFSR